MEDESKNIFWLPFPFLYPFIFLFPFPLFYSCKYSPHLWCSVGIFMNKLCLALTYYSLLSSTHLAGFRWITCVRTEPRISQWNFLWGWKCLSRFTRRGSWNLAIFSFCSQFCLSSLVLLLGCRTLCLETSIQLNGVRIPVQLNRCIANIVSGLKVWFFFFLLWSTIAQVKLPWGNNILWGEE